MRFLLVSLFSFRCGKTVLATSDEFYEFLRKLLAVVCSGCYSTVQHVFLPFIYCY